MEWRSYVLGDNNGSGAGIIKLLIATEDFHKVIRHPKLLGKLPEELSGN